MKNMKVLFTLVVASIIFFTSCSKKEQLPNIVSILADDLGTEVLGCYGGTTYNTPNIDALAETGLKFTQCYSAPLCSPSRVKLLTGRYGFRTGQKWGYIPPNEITFGHILKKAGYKISIAGKWQMALLKDDPNHIKKMGFDESCVFGWHEGTRYYEPLIYENGKIIDNVKNKYGPDVYSDFLIDFIKRNKSRHFFAYYPMSLPHEISNDMPTPPPFGQKGRYETYKENVEYADKLVGKVIKVLDELNLRENTLIIFSGDNGTPYNYITKYENGKYIREPVFSAIGDSLIRGGKKFMTDAGTHVPLIANWEGVTPKGKVNNDLIDFSDFMPTFAELTDAQLPNNRIIDGHSFAPQIMGKMGKPRKWIYQEWEGKSWIRNQDWKLYNDGRLIDMKHDPIEKHPILSTNDTEVSKKIRDHFTRELKKLKGSKD
ncbi:Arylsulfatase [hydrothermal vent metagenome]|uniref:Arylsulfatase n=1 Tax=hydrothermal vent metagenome TaxID=652676 RepID=A0A3B1CTG1_9ZZZZ